MSEEIEVVGEEQEVDLALWDEVAKEVGGEFEPSTPEPQEELAEPEPEAEPEAPDPAPVQDDMRAQLEQLQRERDDWRHRYQSDQGRFLAAQRALQEAAQAKKQDAPTNAEIAQAGVEALKAGRFDEFQREFPEMAEAITDFYRVRETQIFSKLEQELAPLKEAYQRQRQYEEQAAFDRAAQDLTSRHPDWQVYDVNSNAEFANWLSAQPAEVQSLYGKPNAAAASRLIDFYKLDKGARPNVPAEPDRAQKIQQQRQAKLDRNALPPTRKTSVSAEADPDQAMWESIVAKVERQNRRM